MHSTVSEWFGNAFYDLHPKLQQLHRQGGRLSGTVALTVGNGLIARRIAAKLGVPTLSGEYPLQVDIREEQKVLVWTRRFNHSHVMCSTFTPHGKYSEGFWRESTGLVSMDLGVQIKEGAWHWVQKRVRLGAIPIPLFLAPKTQAYKCIEGDHYVFSVEVSLPFWGVLVAYKGALEASVSG